MSDIVIGTVIALIVVAIAVFLLLLAINVALVRKLRSEIPPPPEMPPAERHLAASAKNTGRLDP
jgi:large-conductance mechanosensitive channel